MKEESELKKDNTQTHTCCPKCGCVHVGDCKFQLKDRQTSPVEAKTAEEITLEQLLVRAARYGYEYHETTKFPEMLFDENCKNNFLQFLQSNKAYKTLSAFTPSAKSVEVEEAEWINPDQQLNGADFLIEANKILKTYPNTSSIKIVKLYMRQQQKQAETISRLSGDMEWIAKFCNDPECKRLAKEALSPTNKDTQNS